MTTQLVIDVFHQDRREGMCDKTTQAGLIFLILRGEKSGEQLTGRESEVLRLIARGYSNKEIAEKTDISVKTVEAHKANALKKLKIESRKDIVRYANCKAGCRKIRMHSCAPLMPGVRGKAIQKRADTTLKITYP